MRSSGNVNYSAIYFVCVFSLGASLMLSSPALAQNNSEDLTNDVILENGFVVSCLGDSVTEGVPYSGTGYTYPAQLQVMLDTAYGSGTCQVINRGVGGYKAEDVLSDLQELNLLEDDQPDFVLLMIGGNDLAGADISNIFQIIDETVAEVQEIVYLVNNHTNEDGLKPEVILSAFIPNRLYDFWGSMAISLYNDQLESDLIGVDIWFTANWDDFYDGSQARAELMSDSVHPNIDGYLIMAENWFEVLPGFPVVTNSVGATKITNCSARLNGDLTSTGNATTTVRIYWGESDGEDNPGGWSGNIILGTRDAGTFSFDLEDLSPCMIYYYRCYASNSAGEDWADSTAQFQTDAKRPVVSNSIGASGVTPNSARLNGEITDTGGEDPEVYIYWGESDGGTDPESWDHVIGLDDA